MSDPDIQFLRDWLQSAESSRQSFIESAPSDTEMELIAQEDGFRTARAWSEMREHGLKVMRYFIEQGAFLKLWELLRKQDKADFGLGYSFSPANGGVPSRILSAIEVWHQMPKMTRAQRIEQTLKIRKHCDELLLLLGQITPSHLFDDQFSSFKFKEAEHSEMVLTALGIYDEVKAKNFPSVNWHASYYVNKLGIHPLWALERIREQCEVEPEPLGQIPQKISAKTAMRTYFIRVVHDAISRATFRRPMEIGIGNQLISEIVGLVADMDCSDDDVRKAIVAYDPEDSGLES